jgi:hypothetical protein
VAEEGTEERILAEACRKIVRVDERSSHHSAELDSSRLKLVDLVQKYRLLVGEEIPSDEGTHDPASAAP